MPLRRLLTNARLVLSDQVLEEGALLIADGKIAAVGHREEVADAFAVEAEVTDVGGAYVLPGLVDLHTDTLEKEITPRPGADFPIEVAVQELDRKLVACGITTVFHSLHVGYQEGDLSNRSRYTRREVIDGMLSAATFAAARTRLHLRYEIVGDGPDAYELVRALLQQGSVGLLSYMDHTPGQGQYTRERFISQRIRDGLTEAQAVQLIEEKQARPRLSFAEMSDLSELARRHQVPLASHDDHTAEKVRLMQELGVTICEFPVTPEAAAEARQRGMAVLGGAANVLRGGSLSGNLDVSEGIRAGAINGLCSDYYPPAMLHAIFKLAREGIWSLPQAVAAASAVPAQAVGLGGKIGRLAPGLEADLIIVQQRANLPCVRRTMVGGQWVHATGDQFAAIPAAEVVTA